MIKIMATPEPRTKLLSDAQVAEVVDRYKEDKGFIFIASRIKQIRGDDAYRKYIATMSCDQCWFGSAWIAEYAEMAWFLSNFGEDVATYFVDTLLTGDEKLSKDVGERACEALYFLRECKSKGFSISK